MRPLRESQKGSDHIDTLRMSESVCDCIPTKILRLNTNTNTSTTQAIIPFIEHNLSSQGELAVPNLPLFRKDETSGIEKQDANGENANVCAFTSSMFLGAVTTHLIKLYEVIPRHLDCVSLSLS